MAALVRSGTLRSEEEEENNYATLHYELDDDDKTKSDGSLRSSTFPMEANSEQIAVARVDKAGLRLEVRQKTFIRTNS